MARKRTPKPPEPGKATPKGPVDRLPEKFAKVKKLPVRAANKRRKASTLKRAKII